MIARRLGAATRLSQSLAYAARSPFNAASTSYAQPRTRSHTRSLASSSQPGAFAPSSTRLRKKNAIPAEEEAFEEDEEEEEEDLFAISAVEEVIKSEKNVSKKATIVDRPPFKETYDKLRDKLKYMDPEEAVDVNLSDWKMLVTSVSTEEELRQCFDVARDWKKLTYNVKSKLQRLTLGETRIILKQARNLGRPEVMLDVVMSRQSNGLDFDLDIVRHVQSCIVERMGRKDRQSHIESAARGSMVKAAEEWQGAKLSSTSPEQENTAKEASAEIDSQVELQRAKLSNIDRILALAASTCVFSPGNIDVDGITLLLAISGIVKSFRLHKLSKARADDDFHELQVYPRLGRALIALCTSREGILQADFPHRLTDQETVKNRCHEVRKVLQTHGDHLQAEYGLDKEAAISRVDALEAEALAGDTLDSIAHFNPLAESTV